MKVRHAVWWVLFYLCPALSCMAFFKFKKKALMDILIMEFSIYLDKAYRILYDKGETKMLRSKWTLNTN